MGADVESVAIAVDACCPYSVRFLFSHIQRTYMRSDVMWHDTGSVCALLLVALIGRLTRVWCRFVTI